MPAPLNIQLTSEDRRTLRALVAETSQPDARLDVRTRARILLLCDEGVPPIVVAERLGVGRNFVSRVRRDFLDRGVASLVEAVRRDAATVQRAR